MPPESQSLTVMPTHLLPLTVNPTGEVGIHVYCYRYLQ
jgi:hypothetical protein